MAAPIRDVKLRRCLESFKENEGVVDLLRKVSAFRQMSKDLIPSDTGKCLRADVLDRVFIY